MVPMDVVQRQLDAYNDHDLAAFLETYDDAAVLYSMPGEKVMAQGKESIAQLYSQRVFSVPDHRAELLGRFVMGDTVVAHERVYGLGQGSFEAIAVYAVKSGRIRTVWLFR